MFLLMSLSTNHWLIDLMDSFSQRIRQQLHFTSCVYQVSPHKSFSMTKRINNDQMIQKSKLQFRPKIGV